MFNFSRVRPFLVALFPLGLLLLVTGPSQPLDGPFQTAGVQAQSPDRPCTECCTSLLVGPEASVDGSTMTSHSCDSGTDEEPPAGIHRDPVDATQTYHPTQ